jgi:phosphatidylinositol alpha-mannosyltransferase
MDLFALVENRDSYRPIILFTSALSDQRKGGRVLMEAFNLVKAINAEVVLQISCELSSVERENFLLLLDEAWRCDVEFLGVGKVEELPALYGRATVSVLPSRWESFGMVVTESLATGTPVVGTKDGALPELITEGQTGYLFDVGDIDSVEPTNASGLADAILKTMQLSVLPETATRCRASVVEHSWDEMSPKYEAMYCAVAQNSGLRDGAD